MESLAWRAPRPCQYTVAVPAPPFFFLFFFFGGRVSVLCRMVHLPRCSAHIFFYFFPLFIREGCVSVPFHLCPRWPSQDQSPFPWTPPPLPPFSEGSLGRTRSSVYCMYAPISTPDPIFLHANTCGCHFANPHPDPWEMHGPSDPGAPCMALYGIDDLP